MIQKLSEDQKLTIKQRKWLKAYIKTGSATEAAMQAYDCKSREVAAHVGYENVRKLDFGQLMEEAGLTDVVLNNIMAEGLTKPYKVDINGDKHPDYGVRHKYLDTALKTKKKVNLDENNQPAGVTVNIHPEFLKKYGNSI